MKNSAETLQDIARVKNVGIKFDKRFARSEQMLADGIINIIVKITNFVISSFVSIILIIILRFKRQVIIKHNPKPQISEFMPIMPGKNHIDININIAPST